MTLHLGYVPASSTLYIPFHTFDSNGASVTLTGLAVTDIEIYKNGSATQRASDNGYALLDTDGIDFDGLTGLHGISIDLSDNSDAGFYAAGNFYMVAIASVTVDTRTVNFWAATFFIGPVAANMTQILGTAVSTPATAGILDVNVKNIDNDAASASGTVTFPNATLASTTNITAGTLTTVTNLTNAPTNGDLTATMKASINTEADTALSDYGALKPTTAGRTLDVTLTGAAGVDWGNVENPTTILNLSGTTVKTATDVETDTADIQSRLPAALVTGRMDASVGAMASNTLTAAALATDAVTKIQSGLSTLDAAGVRAAVGLASANLDTQLTAIDDYLDTEVTAIKAKTDNLPAAPAATGDIPTANQNADALLDRANGIETSYSPRQALRLMLASLAGKISGAGTTTVTVRDVNDSKDRLVATVDADGNRTAVTKDVS